MGNRRTVYTPVGFEEWDFPSVPPSEAEACIRYELAREIERPDLYFSRLEAGLETPGLRQLSEMLPQSDKNSDFASYHPEVQTLIRTAYYRPPRIEDNVPWLREIITSLYFSHPDGTYRAYPEDLQQTPWRFMDPGWRRLLFETYNLFTVGVHTFTPEQAVERASNQPEQLRRLMEPRAQQVFLVGINWSRSHAALVLEFSEWLHQKRPEAFPSKLEVGRQSLKDSLNALCAMRLRHKESAYGAMQLTKMLYGEPLYQERSSWERSHRKGVELFHQVYPGAGEPKSATKVSNRGDEQKKKVSGPK